MRSVTGLYLSECESIRRVAAELALANSQNQRGHPVD